MASTTAEPKSADAKPVKEKGSGIGKTLFIVVASAVGAAAGGFGAVIAAGSLGIGGGGHAEAPAAPAHGPVEYIEIDQAFTSNLSDTGRYLQVRLSISQSGGPPRSRSTSRRWFRQCSAYWAKRGRPMSRPARPRTGCGSG